MTVAGLASLESTTRVSPVLVSSSTTLFKKSARSMHPVATSGQIASAAMAFRVAFERALAAEAVPSSKTARIDSTARAVAAEAAQAQRSTTKRIDQSSSSRGFALILALFCHNILLLLHALLRFLSCRPQKIDAKNSASVM